MPPRFSLSGALAAGLLCLAGACNADEAAADAAGRAAPELGLMGTIPIYWGESDGFGELLSGGGSGHWARARLETQYTLQPLDTLSEQSLAGLEYLMLAQPRPLSAEENVALDAWVRGGGKLLLFADPLLTGESRFAIGDRRRPQDEILLSPILRHWGLALEFDDDQPAGYAMARTAGAPLPVNLAGSFTARDGEGDCTIEAGGVLAECAIGAGRAVVLADAALLDLHEVHPGAPAAFDWLLAQSFERAGENAGRRL